MSETIPKKGDVLIITTKKSKGKRLLCQVKEVVNGNELILQKSTNSFFNWDMFLKSESWVTSVNNLGDVQTTSSSNCTTMRNFADY